MQTTRLWLRLQPLLLAWLALFVTTAVHAAPPVNDSILKAIPFQGNYQVVTTPEVGTATAAATDPTVSGVSVGKTIWYRVSAQATTNAPRWYVSVKGLTGSGRLGVYLARDLDNPATSLTGAPATTISAGQTVSFSNFSLGTGTVWYLMLSGAGTYEITHHITSGIYQNDFPFNATDLGTADRGTTESTTHLATVTGDEPSLPYPVTNSVWYTWTPAFSGAAAVDTDFSFVSGDTGNVSGSQTVHDTVLAVYTGTPGALNLVGSDDDSGYDFNSRVNFTATSGVTYYIEVATRAGTPPGLFTLDYFRANTAGEIAFSPGANGLTSIESTGFTTPVYVRRRYAGNFGATAQLTSAAGTATTGADFNAVNATLTFPANGSEVGIFLNPVDDAVQESQENFTLQLSNPSGTATLGGLSIVTLYIKDNEKDEVSSYVPFYLQHPVIRVKEGASGVTSYAVNAAIRSRPTGLGLTLTPSVMSGSTAVKDQDFYAYGAYIDANQIQTQLITAINGDDFFEPDEVINFAVNFATGVSDPKENLYTVIIEDDDPYIPVSGKLAATLKCGKRPAQIFAAISTSGAISGKVQVLGKTLPLKGQLDWRGRARFTLLPAGRAAVIVLNMEATDSTGGFKLTLNDGLSGGVATADVVLQNYAPKINPCPEAGRYTLVSNNITDVAITSAAAITVDASGNAIVAGRIFDGTPFTAAGYIDGAGLMGAQVSLYKGLGAFGVRATLPEQAGQQVSATATIIRPARLGNATQLIPVATDVIAIICQYSPPVAGQRALECWNAGTGKATLSNGQLMNNITKALAISPTNAITAPVDAENLKLTLNTANGTFTGSFIPPGATKATPVFGALMDLPTTNGYGHGFFFNGLKGGKIVIDKP